MEKHAKIVGTVVTVACIALVVAKAASAPSPPALAPATPAQRTMFAANVMSQEDEWRLKVADDFPSDNWSQRDAFHGHEAAAVRDLAAGSNVTYEDVFRAIDDDIHRNRTRDRNANAVPCKPRPIFD